MKTIDDILFKDKPTRTFWSRKELRKAMQEYADQQLAECKDLLEETVFRCNIAMPTTEKQLEWFDEACDYRKSDFIERVYKFLNIGRK